MSKTFCLTRYVHRGCSITNFADFANSMIKQNILHFKIKNQKWQKPSYESLTFSIDKQ